MLKRILFALLCVAQFAVVSTAWAQSTSFNFEHFHPQPSQQTGTLNVARSQVLEHFTPSAGLMLHFQDDPVQLRADDEVFKLVDAQLKSELMLALGFFDHAELGLVLPLVLYQTGEAAEVHGLATGVDGFAVSDLRVVPKVRFLDVAGFGAAVLVPITLPTGDTETYNSDGGVGAEPRLALDWTHDSGAGVAANVGYLLRPAEEAFNYTSGQTLRWAGAVEIPLGNTDMQAVGSVFGSYGLEDGRDPENLEEVASNAKARPIEGLLGVNVDLPAGMMVQLGAGGGFSGGVGAPDFRIYAGLTWSPREKDTDGDGLMDPVDQCVDEPEDEDGWEDTDGCPDPDNDGDNILDGDDGCPDQPEDVDTFEDENGCPDPDNDQDGVLDTLDDCPLVAGAAENKGCPWEDSDGDGLLDNVDKCRDLPEDPDQFEDEDGCPDVDNDKDGIVDLKDQCPNEPETINGNKDDDGCPDDGKVKVKITEKSIEILEKVYFDTNKATIKPRSFNILNQVAAVLKANPQIKEIQIEGHTDSRGRDDKNLDLSQRRAESVKKFLQEAGVAPSRLLAKGFGEVRPIDTNASKQGRAKNRRVEFQITKVEGTVNVETK